MVLKDEELDELWRGLGNYREKIRAHLEAATGNEQTIASLVTERLIREYYALHDLKIPPHLDVSLVTERLIAEYRDLKADYEHDHEALGKLQADYQRRLSDISEWNRRWYDTNKKYEELQRQLMQRR